MTYPRILANGRSWIFVKLIMNGIAQAAATIISSRFIHFTFNTVIKRGDHSWPTLSKLVVGISASAFFIAWLRIVERTDSERMGQDYVKDIRTVVFKHISSVPIRLLQLKSRGGMMLRFVSDLKSMKQWISMGLARVVVTAVSISIALIGLAWLNGPMAIGATVIIILGILISLVWCRKMYETVLYARRVQSQLAANVNEKIGSMAVVQAFGQSERERARVADQGQALKEAMIVQARVGAQLRSIVDITASLASGATMLVGAYEVVAGRVSAATVVAGMSIVTAIVPLLRDLGMVFVYWQGARVSQEKIITFLEIATLEDESEPHPDLKAGAGRLEFRDVRVGNILKGISITAEAKTRIALVGPNGSGKSTLLSLAARLLNPDSGRVLFDHQDLSCFSAASIRRSVGIASPDLPLLAGSVESNLRYRWPDAPDDEVEKISALCGVDEVVRALPEGANTRITEGASNLSLGQRQRIALARALLGNPSVLLLDEVDANLDPRSGAMLDRVLDSYQGTVLIVTHRLDVLLGADAIWFLQDGHLIEAGPPRDLLARRGATTRLFNLEADFAS